MKGTYRLSGLREGEDCRICRLLCRGRLRNRLSDLGFIPGVRVVCLKKSFSGDPVAYKICGTVIALRNSDADDIIVSG